MIISLPQGIAGAARQAQGVINGRQESDANLKKGEAMDKERLKKLKSLIKEAEHLEIEIEETRWFPKEPVTDSAKDYRTGYPRNITIAGYGDSEWVKLRQRLYEKLGRIQAERMMLENWLDSVQDPELRDILRLQYINGLTQEEIADELGYSVITIKRRLRAFWEKVDTE